MMSSSRVSMNTSSASRPYGDSWHWSSGKNRYYSTDLPSVEEGVDNYNYSLGGGGYRNAPDSIPVYKEDWEADSKSQRSRSPIQKIVRAFVEEDKPSRNFGDYDPVRGPRTPPSSDRIRSIRSYMEPPKFENRRVLYVGIPERKSGSWNQVSKAEDEESEEEEQDYGYTDPVEVDCKVFTKPENNDASKFYNYYESQKATTLFPSTRSDCQAPKVYTSDSRSHQLPTSSRNIITSERIGPSGSSKNYSYMNNGSAFQFSNYKDDKNNYSSLVRKPTQTQPQSSWMAYTKGTGFYQQQPFANMDANVRYQISAKVEREDEHLPTEESKLSFKYGYYTRQSHETDPEDEEHGKYETFFCEKVKALKLFYRLKGLPNCQIYGTIYYSFQIEFWPFPNHAFKESVTGHQIANKKAARDSVFSAALKKLESVRLETAAPRSNQLFVSETRPVKAQTPISVEELDWKRAAPHSAARNRLTFQDPSTARPTRQESYMTRTVVQEPARTRAVVQEPPRTRAVVQEPPRTRENPAMQKSGSQEIHEGADSGFRIAIQRGPSIIWGNRGYNYMNRATRNFRR